MLESLLNKFGIDSGATVTAMADAERLVKSVGRFAVANPVGAQALIREIKSGGLEDFGQQLEEIVAKKSIERTSK